VKIKVQMFGDLRRFLPPGSGFNETELEVEEGGSPDSIRAQLGIPVPAGSYLVMLNQEKITDDTLTEIRLHDGDLLTFVPPIKGGSGN
jgi:sulfur carrier protein ThiS